MIVPTPKKDFRPSKIALSLLSKASRNAGLISQPIRLLALLIIPRWKQPSERLASISPVIHPGDRLRGEGLFLFIPFAVENCEELFFDHLRPFHGEIARGSQT